MSCFAAWFLSFLIFLTTASSVLASDGGAQLVILPPQYNTVANSFYEGIKIYHYASGSSTNLDCWENEDKTIPCPSPVSDNAGICDGTANDGVIDQMYCDGEYDFVVKTSAGGDIKTFTNVRVTKDAGTMWEGNWGLAVPGIVSAAKGQQYIVFDAGAHFVSLNINNGTQWVPVISTINSADYIDFVSAVAAIGSTAATLIVNTIETVSANVSIPDTLNVVFESPGQLSIDSGKIVTFAKEPIAGRYQIFSGAGTAGFTDAVKVYPEWWGVKCDGTTDDSVALQKMIDDMEASTGKPEVLYGAGTCLYTVGLTMDSAQGMVWTGSAGGYLGGPTTAIIGKATILYYTGIGTALTVSTGNAYGAMFRNLIFRGTASAADGVYLNDVAGITFRDVSFISFSKVGAGGVHLLSSQLINFERCGFIEDYDGARLIGNAAETTTIEFISCQFHTNGRYGYYDTGSYDVTHDRCAYQENVGSSIFTDYTVGTDGSRLRIKNGYFANNNSGATGYDIDIRGKAGASSAWARQIMLADLSYGSRGALSSGEIRLRNTRQTRLENIKFANATAPNIVAASTDNSAVLLINVDDGLGIAMIQDGAANNMHWPIINSYSGSPGLNIKSQTIIEQLGNDIDQPVLSLDQDDTSEGFIDFIGTEAVDNSASIDIGSAAANAKYGAIMVRINGTDKWIRIYDGPD